MSRSFGSGVFIQQRSTGVQESVPFDSIQRKLDSDFFAGRWARVTDRQRELMWVIANLKMADGEFSIREIIDQAQLTSVKAFSTSQANQMLNKLSDQGLVYKNRFGKYSFAVPLLGEFILRTFRPNEQPLPF